MFGETVGQSVDKENTNINSWIERVKERSSTEV